MEGEKVEVHNTPRTHARSAEQRGEVDEGAERVWQRCGIPLAASKQAALAVLAEHPSWQRRLYLQTLATAARHQTGWCVCCAKNPSCREKDPQLRRIQLLNPLQTSTTTISAPLGGIPPGHPAAAWLRPLPPLAHCCSSSRRKRTTWSAQRYGKIRSTDGVSLLWGLNTNTHSRLDRLLVLGVWGKHGCEPVVRPALGAWLLRT